MASWLSNYFMKLDTFWQHFQKV
uniref:Uncharacterized protein n=1 Tax=Arundo donax TaxID=35708 RepID=A0A0A9EPQ1_ARUDO